MSRLTDAEVTIAESVNILEFVKQSGYELTRVGQDFKVKGHGGLLLSQDGHRWNWFSQNVGGGPIQLVQKLENCSWADAARKLLDISGKYPQIAQTAPTYKTQHKEFTLPPKSINVNHVYAYLIKTRGLEQEVVNALIRNHQLYEDDRHNCCFVGHDKDGTPKYAALRGTYTTDKPFRGEVGGSDKSISFCMPGRSGRAFVVESPIDAASHASLWSLHGRDWRQDTRLSLGGLSDKALERFLKDNPQIKTLVFALDNDSGAENHGQMAAARFMAKYAAQGYAVQNQVPHGKDFNEDLQNFREQAREPPQQEFEAAMEM